MTRQETNPKADEQNPSFPKGTSARHLIKRRTIGIVIASASVVVSLVSLRFCGEILVATDPLPRHADAAIVMLGSYEASIVRRSEAFRLLKAGRVDHVMFGVGKIQFWGEWLPDLVRRDLADRFGKDISSRIVLCEMNATSTRDETLELRACAHQRNWSTLVIVTSNYHTRRTRWVWQEALDGKDSTTTIAVHSVLDGSFRPDGWWRSRRYAKTLVLEGLKLLWFCIEGMPQSTEEAPRKLPS